MSLFPVVILAGGLGTRLRPYTETVPKSLILIEGRPFIDYQLRLLKTQQIRDVLLLIDYLGESIEQYVGNGKRYGLRITYHYDNKQQKGTAGCLETAYHLLPACFFFFYGDSYLLVDFFHVQHQFFLAEKPALMTIYKNAKLQYTNNIDFNGQQIIAYSKLSNNHYSHMDYGLSIFNKTVFNAGRNNGGDLSKYIQWLIQEQALGHYVVEQPFYEIGSIDGINQFRRFIHG